MCEAVGLVWDPLEPDQKDVKFREIWVKGGFMQGETVTIKGTSDGLVIVLGEGPLDEIMSEMKARLNAKASFFLGGRVALQVGQRPLTVEELLTIGSLLQGMNVTLWAVNGTSPRTAASAQELGLETPSGQASAEPTQPDTGARVEMSGIVVERTLRSGQAIQHEGHITLIGDVNPGAELAAGGDIVVWGKLRGTVHAGAMGDDRAIICALELAPNQIRIGTYIARPPDRDRQPAAPEIARVVDGRIVVEQWDSQRNRRLRLDGLLRAQSNLRKLVGDRWNWRLKAIFGQR
jgi:septum site-determining protein MinC